MLVGRVGRPSQHACGRHSMQAIQACDEVHVDVITLACTRAIQACDVVHVVVIACACAKQVRVITGCPHAV